MICCGPGECLCRIDRSLPLTISVVIWVCPTCAVTDSVPNWDVTTGCRGAAEAGFVQETTTNLKLCIDSEQHTGEQLSKDWSTFPATDRAKCVKTRPNEATMEYTTYHQHKGYVVIYGCWRSKFAPGLRRRSPRPLNLSAAESPQLTLSSRGESSLDCMSLQ